MTAPTAHAEVVFTRAGAREALVDGLSPFIGVVVFGAALGVLAATKGVALHELAFMSAFVFAGASQIAAVQSWADPLPVVAILATTAALNVRMLLMGATLMPWLAPLPRGKALALCYFIVDEGWALSLRKVRAGSRDAAYLLAIGVLYWVGWMTATIAGHVAGTAIADPARYGLDFLGAAVFLALMVLVGPRRRDLVWIAVAVALAWGLAAVLPQSLAVLLGALVAALLGASLRRPLAHTP